jgi:hypothetical protein
MMAKVTVLEPFPHRPFDLVVSELVELVLQADYTIHSCLVMRKLDKGNWKSDGFQDAMETYKRVLRLCAKCLTGKKWLDIRLLEQERAQLPKARIAFEEPTGYISRRCKLMVDATLKWHHSLDFRRKEMPPWKERIKVIFQKRLYTWFILPFYPIARIFYTASTCIVRKQHNKAATIWAIKVTIGYTALYAAQIYLGLYNHFTMTVPIPTNNPILSFFNGWAFITYSFAWTPTSEGTVKKGVLRIIGICLGAFIAWLGAIICSGSLSDYPATNPFAVPIWLTFFLVLGTWFGGLGPGAASMLVQHEMGYLGGYFALSLTLITLEFHNGNGPRQDWVRGRLSQLIAGTLFAMVLSIIPPSRKGGGKEFLESYVNSMQSTFYEALDIIHEKGDYTLLDHTFKMEHLARIKRYGKRARTYYLDANRINFFPYFKCPPEVGTILADAELTESLIERLIDYVTQIDQRHPNYDPIRRSALNVKESKTLLIGSKAKKEQDAIDEAERAAEEGSAKKIFEPWAKTLRSRLLRHKGSIKKIP